MAARLKRLKVYHYRGVAKDTELSFADGINVILGKNGTGKTTLLDLVALILTGNLSSLHREHFHLEFTIENIDSWSLHVEVRNDERNGSGHNSAVVNLHLQTQGGASWSIQFDETDARMSGPDGNLSLPRNMSEPLYIDWLLYEIPMGNGLRVFSGDEFHRYDEMLGTYQRMMGSEFSIRRSSTVWALDHAFLPTTLTSSPPEGEFAADRLPFLKRVEALFGVRRIDVEWALRDRTDTNGTISERFGPPKFHFHTSSSLYTQDSLSYGQKRFLSFQYYLAALPDFAVADELVNGLHHSWIEACMQDIGERQAFLTSQNPLLLDYLPGFDSPEQLSQMFILCRPATDRSYTWENMPLAEAKAMFSAYEAGIQPMGEILLSKGLW